MSSTPRSIRMKLPEGGLVHRVGKLRAGIKVSRMKDNRAIEYPSAVDYFVVKEDQSTSETAAASFHERYGDEPKDLDVMLPGHMPEECLEGAWRMYGTGGLLKRKCSGPGGECVTRDDAGEWVEAPCVCAAQGIPVDDKKRHCAERWTLSVVLPDVTGLGVWQFDTGSHMAGEGMAAMLNLIYGLRGSLLRAECKLRLVPRQVAPEGKVKTVYIAVLESEETPRAMLAAGDAGTTRLALPPSSLDEAPDELLDAEQIEEGVAEYDAETGEVLDYEPVTMPAIGQQLKTLGAMERADLYRLCGIEGPMKAADAKALLIAKADELNLPFHDPPNVHAILSRARLLERENLPADAADEFQHFADTGQDLDQDAQTVIA